MVFEIEIISWSEGEDSIVEYGLYPLYWYEPHLDIPMHIKS